jgi:hypothetical protein
MSMFPHVIEANYVKDHVIHLRFQDGIAGEVDLADRLFGEIFEPLKEPVYFRQFRVDPDLQTLVWPNGADFAPEFLYERVQVPV